MVIKSATAIYFSPTGTTKKIINSIIKGMGLSKNTVSVDLTDTKVRDSEAFGIDGDVAIINGDIFIIGVPVYEERIPKMVNSFLNNLKGEGKPVVLISVYGNFGDGIALNELESITKNIGFKPVAAASFIGEHSFSTKEVPVQEGRPDYEDLCIGEEFGRSIMIKMKKIEDLNKHVLTIPEGSLPLMAKVLPKDSARFFTKLPLADMNICNHCGVCERLCPMNAIDKETLQINADKCIRCFSCVKRCPKKARKIIYRPKFIVSKVLRAKNKFKNTPKIFL